MTEHADKLIPLPAGSSVENARLPAVYEAAKAAIIQCERVDECAEWADRMAALASYAKQIKDDSLERAAMRIRARAVKRCGELLAEIKRPPQGGRPTKNRVGAGPVSRADAARDAGMSQRQKKTALRVAAVPDVEFEQLIDSSKPPTVTALAARGTKPQRVVEDHLEGRDPKDFQAATGALGEMERLAEYARKADQEAICRGLDSKERARIARHAKEGAAWLAKFIARIERGEA